MGPRGQKRHDELLQAALELFAANGYDGASTRSIAEQTGVTEAVLFKHFPTKRDLFLAVLDRFGPAQLIRLPVDELDALPFREALQRQVQTFLDQSYENRQWLHVIFHTAKREPEAGLELRRQYESVRESVRRLLLLRAERGEVRAELVEPALQTIHFAMRGFNMHAWHQSSEQREQDREIFVSSLAQVVAEGIAPTKPAPKARNTRSRADVK